MGDIIIRNTKNEDTKKLVEIYNDAKAFMEENNNFSQWNKWRPEKSTLLEMVKNKTGYVIEKDGEILAGFQFFIGIEKDYEKIYNGSWKNTDSYGVIHKVAVNKNMHGQGLSKICFDFCKEMCIKNGVNNMKIDTHKDNAPMIKTLLKYGFSYCGIVYTNNGNEMLGYQYEIK